RRLPIAPGARRARTVWTRQPGTARGGPRAHRDARSGGGGRPHVPDPEARARRPRWHRLRPRRHRGTRRGGRSQRRGRQNHGQNGAQGPVGVDRTPAPSNVIVVPPEAAFQGSIVYAKQGNIWIQQDKDVKQLTDGGRDSMPSWSPDGQSIVFIRTHDEDGFW